MLENKKP